MNLQQFFTWGKDHPDLAHSLINVSKALPAMNEAEQAAAVDAVTSTLDGQLVALKAIPVESVAGEDIDQAKQAFMVSYMAAGHSPFIGFENPALELLNTILNT
jgi:hypothetical protein